MLTSRAGTDRSKSRVYMREKSTNIFRYTHAVNIIIMYNKFSRCVTFYVYKLSTRRRRSPRMLVRSSEFITRRVKYIA